MYRTFDEMCDDLSICNYCIKMGYPEFKECPFHICEGAYCSEAYNSYLDDMGLTENIIEIVEKVELKDKGEGKMSTKLNFEFDFDEVFKGIKEGVIKELAEFKFEETVASVKSDVKEEIKKGIELDWGDKEQIKQEIKQEIKQKVFDTYLDKFREREEIMLRDFFKELTSEKDVTFQRMRERINKESAELLYTRLLRDVQYNFDSKVKSLSSELIKAIGGDKISIATKREDKSTTEQEYNKLLQRDRLLMALEANGVDNWEGYYESIQQLNEEMEEE